MYFSMIFHLCFPGVMVTACRELLLNTVKHACVEKADLYLDRKNGTIRLKVEDQGRGFYPGAIESSQSNGFGLLNIRERITANRFAGNILVGHSPGGKSFGAPGIVNGYPTQPIYRKTPIVLFVYQVHS